MMLTQSSNSSNEHDKCNEFDLIFTILNNFVNANHSINFFIYYFTNSIFKTELNSLFNKLKSRVFGVFFNNDNIENSNTNVATIREEAI